MDNMGRNFGSIEMNLMNKEIFNSVKLLLTV